MQAHTPPPLQGLKRGLYQLIVECGLPLKDLCTDQCRGAPSDIKAVLAKPTVQKLMAHLPQRMRDWVGRELGCTATPSEAVPAGPWANTVATLRDALDAMAAVTPSDLAQILHH